MSADPRTRTRTLAVAEELLGEVVGAFDLVIRRDPTHPQWSSLLEALLVAAETNPHPLASSRSLFELALQVRKSGIPGPQVDFLLSPYEGRCPGGISACEREWAVNHRDDALRAWRSWFDDGKARAAVSDPD